MAQPQDLAELIALWERKRTPPEELCRDHPDLLPQLKAVIEAIEAIEAKYLASTSSDGPNANEGWNRATFLYEKWCALQKAGVEISPEELCRANPGLMKELTKRIVNPCDQTVSGSGTPAPQPSNTSALSSDTLGRYKLEQFLGKGGFGEVWQAYDPVLDKKVAIKRPRTDRRYSDSQIDAFLKEARKAASLRHPGIVTVHNAERDVAGWYIVSDLVDGKSLREYLIEHRLSMSEIARLVAEVADALHVAHLQGLIHRDVKLDNILIDGKQRPYLTDFGLAISEEEQAYEKDAVAGTHVYMSPEQIRGESHNLDGRSDIYSLGVVLYSLLTGRLPFKARDFEGYRQQILEREPRPPRSIDDTIPSELERICLKCMAKEVSQRYTTAKDLATDLRSWLAEQNGTPLRPIVAARQPRPLTWVLGLAGLFVVGVMLWKFVPLLSKNSNDPLIGEDAIKLVSLLPPRQEGVGSWQVSKSNTLNVNANGYTLLGLGEVGKETKEFIVQVRQTIPNGRIGVFFGYSPSPIKKDMQQYHVVQLTQIEGSRYELRVSLMHVRRSNLAGSQHETLTTRIELKDFVLDRATLGFRVQDQSLVAVLLNGKEVAGAAETHNRNLGAELTPVEGEFGIFTTNTSGTFAHPILDGREVRLAGGG